MASLLISLLVFLLAALGLGLGQCFGGRAISARCAPAADGSCERCGQGAPEQAP